MPREQFAMIPVSWAKLPVEVIAVLIALDGAQGRLPSIRLSHSALAAAMGCDEKTAKRRLGKARDLGVVELVRASSGRGSNVYRVVNPSRVDADTHDQVTDAPRVANAPVNPVADDPENLHSPVADDPRSIEETRKPQTLPQSPLSADDSAVAAFTAGVESHFPEVRRIRNGALATLIGPHLADGWDPTMLAEALNQSYAPMPDVRFPENLLRERLARMAKDVRPMRKRESADWCGDCESANYRWVTVQGKATFCPVCSPQAMTRKSAAF